MTLPPLDDALAPFVASLRSQMEQELQERRPSRPSDAGASQWRVSGQGCDDAPPQLAPLERLDPQLASFARALGQDTEAALLGQNSDTLVPLARARSKRARSWLVSSLAAAALLTVLPQISAVRELGMQAGSKMQRLLARSGQAEHLRAELVSKARTKSRRSTPSPDSSSGFESAPPQEQAQDKPQEMVQELAQFEESSTAPESASPQPAPPAKKTTVRRHKQAASESDKQRMERAHRLWRKGKLPAAQRVLRSIAYKSSDRDLAQAAFADLFSIGRQLQGRVVLVKEWQRYLRRFPRGRYAQDAMAGQCLAHAASQARAQCWKDYLKAFPDGSYAKKAASIK